MGYEAKVIADSIASRVRLVTIAATYPRIIHSELMTHRTMSRNAASSRAIPVEKNIERVLDDPFVPEVFGKNQKGMQAGDPLVDDDARNAEAIWRGSMLQAVQNARSLAHSGVHKHLANRLLEPHSWITTIITATEWENFFALRCNKDAAPEFQKIAEMMREAMKESQPFERQPGEWHLPLVTANAIDYTAAEYPIDDRDVELPIDTLVKLSVARCARVSYLTHEGKRDVGADLALYDRLVKSGHMSPLEHAAKVATGDEFVGPASTGPYAAAFYGNLRAPWLSHRKMIPGEDVFHG